jgi:hypothetical protein
VENKEDALRAVRKYVQMDPAYAPAGYEEYKDSFSLNGYIAEKTIPVVIEQEYETGRIKRKVSLDELIDRSFINSLGKK